ncbi:MAG: HD domain-containing protein [Sulfuricurvum sp.]|nr:HD domain-containing protein [Sulfuricurvum sp.]MDD5387272.1 HD domain-containing protein [Sulfuricurvum sp.]
MAKVAKIIINHEYNPISMDILMQGEVIPFDIYIKRYNNFVVIIESGTILDENLMKKLINHETMYIKYHDSDKLNDYMALHNSIPPLNHSKKIADPISEALNITEKSTHISDLKQKLFFVYSTTAELTRYLFEKRDENLHHDALYACVRGIIDTLNTNINAMPIILKFMPETYTTHNHSTNVAFFVTIIGNKLKMSQEELIDLTYAGLLHDIGKIRIDSVILDKPSTLKEDEFETVKQHSVAGYEILVKNGIINQIILQGVKHHHERLDGSGYPEHLPDKMIPKAARIIGMCDTFDALTTKRTFRKNYTSFEALLMMKRDMSTQFDESLVDILIQMLR